ncbi:MAG: hypothetical protein PHN31_02490 [Candidatus Gracilibacteria bacterium]|nr:hypothetical protein [Candidatus Gracilibacteria bacterium]
MNEKRIEQQEQKEQKELILDETFILLENLLKKIIFTENNQIIEHTYFTPKIDEELAGKLNNLYERVKDAAISGLDKDNRVIYILVENIKKHIDSLNTIDDLNTFERELKTKIHTFMFGHEKGNNKKHFMIMTPNVFDSFIVPILSKLGERKWGVNFLNEISSEVLNMVDAVKKKVAGNTSLQ